ncbi:MAG: DUF3489 domain-containing protein [Alphaproteobacteria bacterium]|nr:MAG: DUF3489 domain-containing protein [Alphaproteobacteria bacterium]
MPQTRFRPLTELQRRLLDAAARRPDRVIELPAQVKGGAANRVLKPLIDQGLIAPRDRICPEGSYHGVFVLTETAMRAASAESSSDAGRAKINPLPGPSGKQARLLDMMRRPEGATLDEMRTATGWQAHTARAMISRVARKKMGLRVMRTRMASGETVYRIE